MCVEHYLADRAVNAIEQQMVRGQVEEKLRINERNVGLGKIDMNVFISKVKRYGFVDDSSVTEKIFDIIAVELGF